MARITQAIEGIRARGYDVGLETPSRKRIADLLARRAHEADPKEWEPMLADLFKTLAREENQIVGPIDPRREYLVNYIMAPMVNVHGEALVCLKVLGFEDPLSGEEIQKIGEVVVQAGALAGLRDARRRPIRRTIVGHLPRHHLHLGFQPAAIHMPSVPRAQATGP